MKSKRKTTLQNLVEYSCGMNWFENGQVKEEVHYKNGKLNGLATTWFEDGQIEIEEFYKNGKLIS